MANARKVPPPRAVPFARGGSAQLWCLAFLRRYELSASRHEFVGVNLTGLQRSGDAAILLEDLHGGGPIRLRTPAARLTLGVRSPPGLPRLFQFELGNFRHGRSVELFHDGDRFVHVLPAVDEAFDRRRNEGASEIGIALERILMHDDAV